MGEGIFTAVSVAGAPATYFCVDPTAGDAVGDWFLTHDEIDEPVQRVFLDLVEPGMRVLDLGCHLGTFALPAAALGASVLAVDAAASHVALVNAAAVGNHFVSLHAVQRAIADAEEPVAFVERSIHGHVVPVGAAPGDGSTIQVEPATVDALLDDRGWGDVDLVKIDIEGLETAALGGMRRLFARGSRPPIVFECNGSTLPRYGSSTYELRERLTSVGYELLLIDHLRPGTLVESDEATVQTECVCDYVALARRTKRFMRRWRIEPPFTREQVVCRLHATAAGDGGGYRAYAASLLVGGPAWLREDPETPPALAALASDVDAVARAAAGRGGARSWLGAHHADREPASGGVPSDVRAWARGVHLRGRSSGLEQPLETAPGPVLLEDISLHVGAGRLIAIGGERDESASALLRLLAGMESPHAGALVRRGRAALVGRVGEGFECSLTVAENIELFGAFLGCAVADARQARAAVAELAAVADRLAVPLDELDAATVAGLGLAVVLEMLRPELLLVDRLPVLADGARERLAARVRRLRGEGGAVVQAVGEPQALLGPVDRALWLDGSRLVAAGHAPSVFEAIWRRRLGLAAHAQGAPA